MARQRKQKEKDITDIKLIQPDRSGPDPTQQTLLDLADQRGLFDNQAQDDEPLVGRLGDSILWSISLAMLHTTLDVLVQHQYAVEISWPSIFKRSLQALPIIFLFFYTLHPHPTPSGLLPLPPKRFQHLLHQSFFFVGGIASGCYLIYITNEHGYYAVMKRAPPMGCLWIWSVVELDLLWGLGSLVCCAIYWRWNNYVFL